MLNFIQKLFKKESIKPRMIDYYMQVADLTANLSRAKRLKVGCIVVKDDAIISQGWNGTPRGFDNDCEDFTPDIGLKTKPEVVHAEINVLSKIARGTHSSKDAIMFITHSPCYECSKAIIQSGIKKVYFKDSYRDDRPIKFLRYSSTFSLAQ